MTTARNAPLWARVIATWFGAGWMKPGPGTWGSAAALVLWKLATLVITSEWRTLACVLAVAVVMAIGIPAGTLFARAAGKEDPSQVVVDEVAGQLVAFIAVPVGWKPLLAAFLLFRAFDILKPPPVRLLERLPEGTGIMMDDIGAGAYALAIMHLLLHYGILR